MNGGFVKSNISSIGSALRVAVGQRRQAEAVLDEAQDRRVVVHDVRHEVRLRERRDDRDRHPHAVLVEARLA